MDTALQMALQMGQAGFEFLDYTQEMGQQKVTDGFLGTRRDTHNTQQATSFSTTIPDGGKDRRERTTALQTIQLYSGAYAEPTLVPGLRPSWSPPVNGHARRDRFCPHSAAPSTTVVGVGGGDVRKRSESHHTSRGFALARPLALSALDTGAAVFSAWCILDEGY